MEFCVGDRVLVRDNLSNYYTENMHEVFVNDEMLHFIGKQYVIIDVRDFYGEKLYKLIGRLGTHWWFVSKWLMPAQGRVDMY